MNHGPFRRLLTFFFPSGLMFAGALAAREWDVVAETVRPFIPVFGYGVFGAGTVLAWRYNRSRAVFALWILFLAGWGLPRILPSGDVSGYLPQAVALLIPLNLLAFAFLRERGVLTVYGFTTIGILFAEVLGTLSLNRFAAQTTEAWLTYRLVETDLFHWTWIGQPALLGNLIVLVVLAVVYFFRGNPVDRGMIWAQASAFAGLHWLAQPESSFYYFAVSGLIVQQSVMGHAHQLAYRDALTQIPARRAFDEYLPKLGRKYAIAMVDVDHFKKFNDRHGHETGDQVLKLVATQLATIEGGGRAFRYGGEEFAVVFRRRSAEEAMPYLEAMRVKIQKAGFQVRGKDRPTKKPKKPSKPVRPGMTLSVTVSIGVAERTDEHDTPELVLEAADKALYRAKEAGRNQVKMTGRR